MKLTADTSKQVVFNQIEKFILEEGFTVSDTDKNRPWGGFFVIEENNALRFIDRFFPEIGSAEFEDFNRLSPKILIVAPEKRLSWQYHHRRAEIWKAVRGRAGVIVSDTDEESELRHLEAGEVVKLEKGQRHRLVGLNQWGVIAEVWKHTDPNHPSDEDDIVRVQDDFGR